MEKPDKNPLERLDTARKDLSRLLEELRRFEDRLNRIARDLESLPPAVEKGRAPPQSVSRADAPVLNKKQSKSDRGD